MPPPRPPARLAAVAPAAVRSLEHSHSGNRPIAPCLERSPLARLPLPNWTLCAGWFDLGNIEGFLHNPFAQPPVLVHEQEGHHRRTRRHDAPRA